MPNLTEDPMPTTVLAFPLPRFGRQPIMDPDLPEVTDGPGPATEPNPAPESPDPLQPSNPIPGPPLLPDPSPAPPARTRISSAGDPLLAAEVVAGLVALACGIAAGWLRRTGRYLRQPTPGQIDDVAGPVGRILARHLPTEIISKDLVDATRAAGAAHRYVIDGPLVERIAEPIPSFGDNE
jgi:hypothetical protein